jgi:DEAD/DEAH box helicase domain-containing protein
VRCAAFELPFAEGQPFGRFPHTQQVLDFLEEEGVLRHSGRQWHWADQAYPAEGVSLRTAEMDNFSVVNTTQEGAVIGVVDRTSAPLLLHEEAVYIHGGEAYLVRELDWEGRLARVEPAELGYYTQASASVQVEVMEVQAELVGRATQKATGTVRILSRPTSFKKVRLYTHEVLGWGDIDAERIPQQEMETTAYWFNVLPQTTALLEQEGLLNMARDDRGPNWEQQRSRARKRDGHRCRHCGAPERADRGHDVHHVVPFRTFGYRRGENDRYLEANRLENLVTLCRSCHRRVEVDLLVLGTLSALAHVIGHIAPLYLMCDPRDIGVVSEVKSALCGLPTCTIYDNAPGGLGFSEELYRLHDSLLLAARELVAACRCSRGCPSCVGPVAEVGEDAKANCLRLVELLLEFAGP